MSSTGAKPAHSEIGASSMERWKNCAASVRLSRGIPNVSSVYAEDGNLAHKYASDWLEGKLPPDNLDPEMYDAISVYVEYVQKLWRSFKRHDNMQMFIERKFDLSQIYPGLFGTADCVLYDAAQKVLHVVDFKYGQGIPVDPENNPQLMYYGLGALLSMNAAIEKVVLTIVQPRYSPDIKDAIKSAEVDSLDMLDFSADLKEYAEKTADPNSEPVTGDHCQFCRAKPVCPALQKAAELAVHDDFAVEKLSSLPAEEVGSLLDKLDLIEFWCKGVREFAYQEAKAGRLPTGYKLVPKRSTRKWADPEMARKEIEKNIHSSTFNECLTEPELKSPAQVEKVLGKANKPLVDSLTISVSSGDTLVHESDKRQATSPADTAKTLFADDLL